jgi:hypothetical protein
VEKVRRWSNYVRPLDKQEGDVLEEGEIRSEERSIHTLQYERALNVEHDVEQDPFWFK